MKSKEEIDKRILELKAELLEFHYQDDGSQEQRMKIRSEIRALEWVLE